MTHTIDKNEINKLISNNPEMFGLMDCNVLGKHVFDHIDKSQNIHTFGLHSCNGLCDEDLKCVGLLKSLRQLYFCNMPFTGKCLDYFEKCPNLTVLYWIFIKTKYYSWLSRLPYLKTLLLYHSDVTGDILPHLGRCQNLKTVDLSFGNLKGSDGAPIRQLTNIEYLTLDSLNIEDAFLSHFVTLKKLQSLALYHNNITDEGINHLGTLYNLDTLFIGMDNITDQSMLCIKNLAKLTFLSMCSTQITDDALLILSQGSVSNSLQGLDLTENSRLTPKSIEIIFEKLPYVTSVDISDSNNMSEIVENFNGKKRKNGVELCISCPSTFWMTSEKYMEKRVLNPEIPNSMPNDLFSIEDD